jgi:hypothetical protein
LPYNPSVATAPGTSRNDLDQHSLAELRLVGRVAQCWKGDAELGLLVSDRGIVDIAVLTNRSSLHAALRPMRRAVKTEA